jgi:hypothetical protein
MDTDAKKDTPGAAPEADVVTQIQDHIALICARFYNFIGALQRDAPPAPLHSEVIPDQRHEHLQVGSTTANLLQFKDIYNFTTVDARAVFFFFFFF